MALNITFDKSTDDGAGADDVASYSVRYSTANDPAQAGDEVGTVAADGSASYTYSHAGHVDGAEAFVSVVAVDDAENESTALTGTVNGSVPTDFATAVAALGPVAAYDWSDAGATEADDAGSNDLMLSNYTRSAGPSGVTGAGAVSFVEDVSNASNTGRATGTAQPVTGTAARSVVALVNVAALASAATDGLCIATWGVRSGEGANGERYTVCIYENGTTGDYVLRVEVGGGSVQGTAVLDDGAWHLVAATLPANAILDDHAFYVDGVADALSTSSAQAVNTAATRPLVVGARPGSTAPAAYLAFSEDLGPVYVFDKALTAQEVADLYAALTA